MEYEWRDDNTTTVICPPHPMGTRAPFKKPPAARGPFASFRLITPHRSQMTELLWPNGRPPADLRTRQALPITHPRQCSGSGGLR
eukprot:8044010-Lingulodinium_polyedra.AAC.1